MKRKIKQWYPLALMFAFLLSTSPVIQLFSWHDHG